MDKAQPVDAAIALTAATATAADSGTANSVPATAPLIDFVPLTWTLPGEYAVFADEFKRAQLSASASSPAVFIVKPNAKSQGKGIELLHKAAQLKRWAALAKLGSDPRHTYVVSRYIADPLLIGGRKFDLRMYVLVTRYRPSLKAWVYREGFARFCNVAYDGTAGSLANSEMHLTNVAIQKHGDTYNESHGNKWSVASLKLYLQATRGHAATSRLFEEIDFIFIHSLRAVAPLMSSDKHCFELYGFDLLLDSSLRPWLLEVNASPSLSVTTRPDKLLKTRLIADTLAVVVPPDFPSTATSKGSTSWNNHMQVGGFDLLFDEQLMAGTQAAGGGAPGGEEVSRSNATRPSTAGPSSGGGSSSAFPPAGASTAADSSRPSGKWR